MAVALYWWHMDLKLDQKEVVKRAHAATSSALKGGKLKSDDDSVTFFSSSLITTVACVSSNKGVTKVVVIAAGEDGDQTRGIMQELRDGVRTGGPFE